MLVAPHLPLALNLLDPHSVLASGGALAIFLIIFAETGLLIGFFLPGDSLLFTAGLLCATQAKSAVHLSLPVVLVAAATGALTGAEVGYLIGRRAGRSMLDRPERPRLQKGLRRSGEFIERYGPRKAVVLARFIPVVRTALNPLAGAIRMPLVTFTVWQVIGGLVWSLGLTMAGYVLGSRVSNVDRYLLPVIALIVVASFIPIGIGFLRHRGGKASAGKELSSRALRHLRDRDCCLVSGLFPYLPTLVPRLK
jgi:membrane-associated protein